MTLKPNTRGAAVIELQNLLNNRKFSIEVDGIYGAATTAAVRSFQKTHGLVVDGIAGNQTLNTLKGATPANDSRTLSHNDIAAAAASLGVDLASVLAVTEVEARKNGFDSQGNPVVLFERHHFYRQMKKNQGEALCSKTTKQYPQLCSPKPGGYLGGTAEWHRLQSARAIDDTAALLSASYGLFQIMGFNYATCGFASVQSFVTAMSQSEGKQLKAFVCFVSHKSNAGMLKALKAKQWASFAKLYNGPNYAINDYDHKLAAAYRRYEAAA